MAESFESMGLENSLVKALKKEKINVPTDIQTKTIPEILLGKDLIIQSETGTGKTLAYLLPLFEKFKDIRKEMKVLILAPTYELVIQIQRQIEKLAENSGLPIASTPLIGSANIARQIEKLKDKPQFLVGSPGRVLELIKKGKIQAQTLQTVVLDEADRLMDLQNIEPILAILKSMRKERQLLLVSATVSMRTIDKSKEIMKDPQIIRGEGTAAMPDKIEHYYFLVDQRDKIELLRKLIFALRPRKALVFLNKSDQIDILCSKLRHHNIKTESLHGTNIKIDRRRALEDFKKGRVQVMIASDIAARGLHIDDITHVFNMDIPEDPKDYIHRAGRTGRNSKAGMVLSLSTRTDLTFIRKIEKTLKITIEYSKLVKGEIIENEEEFF